jgi:chitin disaccharide deacetylase
MTARANSAIGTLAQVKRLIVNADDFGLTAGINTAILELHVAGILTSSTLMAPAPCFAAAVHLAFAQTSLGVGCHVILVDGSPLLPGGEVGSLIGGSSGGRPRFRPTLGGFVRDLLGGRIREAEIEAEAVAQIRRIQSSGLRVTHLDTHKHTHMFPGVLRPLLRAAQRCEVGAVRNPFEPAWSVRATPGGGRMRRLAVRALGTQRLSFAKAARQKGVATTDGAVGVQATGTLDPPTLRNLLEALPEGVWELVCHPGYCDRDLEQTATRLRASREIERQALLAVLPQRLVEDPELTLINFSQL